MPEETNNTEETPVVIEKKRLYRSEKVPILMLMNVVSSMKYATEDLKDRLESIRDGNERMQNLLDEAWSLLKEVRETIPDNQRKNLSRTAMDYEVRLVPKMTQPNVTIILEKEDVRQLVDGAQAERCTACVMDSNECRNCPLEKVLEKVVPLDRYDSVLCPYNMAPWEN